MSTNPIVDFRKRNILIANRVAALFGILSLMLLLILILLFDFTTTSPLILGAAVFFFAIILLNNKGYDSLGRLLLSTVPPVITLAGAILAKTNATQFTDILYYDTRFFLILLSVVPCLVFSISEPVKLYGCLLLILVCILGFDPLHEAIGLGYFQRGFTGRSYYFINYVTAITFTGITLGCISLKWIIEKTDRENQQIGKELMAKNQQMAELLKDLETHNEEMTAQSEELFTSQEQIMEANKIIEKQKEELEKQVSQTSSNLQEANNELVKHNNELRQFSYTISHNLRGPVARLLGLTQVAALNDDINKNQESSSIINHIKNSARELDNVISDLNKIVDVRNTVYQLKQRIDFHSEWNETKSLLHIDDETEKRFKVDFSAAPVIYSVKPMINSILFNLVSNAIKYQSPRRTLEVNITTHQEDQYTILKVSDNGLGINLPMFQHDIFRMYKRFHGHQEGKGLGLYLVKSQAESLNGFVKVDSEPNRGTTFEVYIKNPAQVDDQISLNSEHARIYFNAVENFLVVRWLKASTEEATKELYFEALEFFRQYKVPTLVNDLRNLDLETRVQHLVLMDNITQDAISRGLLILGIVAEDDASFELQVQEMLGKHAIKIIVGDNYDTVRDHIRVLE